MARHSAKYQTVLTFYLKGLWSETRVRNAVGKWITAKEAEEILAQKGAE